MTIFKLNAQETSSLVMAIKQIAQKNSDLEATHANIAELIGEELFTSRNIADVKAHFAKDKLKFAQKVVAALGDDGCFTLAKSLNIISEEKIAEVAAYFETVQQFYADVTEKVGFTKISEKPEIGSTTLSSGEVHNLRQMGNALIEDAHATDEVKAAINEIFEIFNSHVEIEADEAPEVVESKDVLLNALNEARDAALIEIGDNDTRATNRVNNIHKELSTAIADDVYKTCADVISRFDTLCDESAVIKNVRTKIKSQVESQIAAKEAAHAWIETRKTAVATAVAKVTNVEGEDPVIIPEMEIQQFTGVSVEEFLAINDYPFNRDVKDRIKRNHLKGAITSHQQRIVHAVLLDKERNAAIWKKVEVEAALLLLDRTNAPFQLEQDEAGSLVEYNGKFFTTTQVDVVKANNPLCSLPLMKLDGHSRAYAWDLKDADGNSHLEQPKSLFLMVWVAPLTDDQVLHEVKVFGSPLADISTAENADMANKAIGFKPKSEFVSKPWKSPFKLAKNLLTEQEGREYFLDALKFVDSFGLDASYKKQDSKESLKIMKGGKSTTQQVSKYDRYLSSGVKAGLLRTFDKVKGDADKVQVWEKFWSEYFNYIKGSEVKSAAIKSLQNWITVCVESSSNHGNGYDVALLMQIVETFEEYQKES